MSESQTITPQHPLDVRDESQTPPPQDQKEDSGLSLETDRSDLVGEGDQGGDNPFDIELTQVLKICFMVNVLNFHTPKCLTK